MSHQGRKRIGLALGGGVVRGLAHVGVIDALEQASLRPDCLAGTSAGAIIAVTYAAGLSVQVVRQLAQKIHWWLIVTPVFPLRGLVSLERLSCWLIRHLGDLEFQDLKIPCSVVATDIETGERVVIDQGRVAPAIQASCSVPGFIAPVLVKGRWLCDGGLTDMLPVSVLRKMGTEYVIGVDIFEFHLRRQLGPLGYLWAGQEILLERAGGGIEQANLLIAPQLQGETYVRFSKRERLFELGRQAALEKIPQILQDTQIQPGTALAQTCVGTP